MDHDDEGARESGPVELWQVIFYRRSFPPAKAPSPNVSPRPITAPTILSKPLLFSSSPFAPLEKKESCTEATNGKWAIAEKRESGRRVSRKRLPGIECDSRLRLASYDKEKIFESTLSF